ncbi:MAG: 5'/3'-nucleotidase SurE [Gammaproteobacteria bacterium RIFCSPLOWO2_02_FULL_61_13]|nr:MAG: 5'/3'-nucleotidase SurE [Gammaproteobacteria bacterium RIFCSPLOWO2_02_FULL_61_13]
MHFLVSNDDGYQSAGIEALAAALSVIGRVTVVAPDRNRSGASNSLTLDAPLYTRAARNGFTFVNGTPTDCVHLAVTGLLEHEPDMVLSGINSGPNLGDDVLYSGTVAAAMEARFLGRPAVALSLAGENPVHYDAAARATVELVQLLMRNPDQQDLLLNINFPDVPYEEYTGWEVTRLGHRHKSEPAVRMQDPKRRTVYWVGPVGPGQDAGPGTDFHAVARNAISVTPMQVDLTRHGLLVPLAELVSGLNHAKT